MSLIIKNVDTVNVSIDDLGITLVPSEEYDLIQDRSNKIATSNDLPAAITAGEIVVLDPLDNVTQLALSRALAAIGSMNDTHYRIRGGDLNQLEDVTITSIATNDILRYNGSTFTNTPSTSIGAGASFQLEWAFTTSTTDTDPGSGNFGYNTATLASVTSIRFSDVSVSGVNVSSLLLELAPGDAIYIQQNDVSSSAVLFDITSVTDNVGWVNFGVTVVDNGILHTNTKKCAALLFFIAPLSSARIVQVSANDTTPNYLDDKLTVSTGLVKTITNPSGNESINIAPANDLAAVEGLATTGLAVRTGTETWATRTITGTTNQIDVTNGGGIAGNPLLALAANTIIPGTEGIDIPSGTTAERPISPTTGVMRFNTTTGSYEAWDGVQWVNFGAAAGSSVKEILFGQLAHLQGTSVTPADDTPPLITEGSQFFTQTVTMSTGTGRVVLWFSSMVSVSNSNRVATVALYRDTTLIGITTVGVSGSNNPTTATFIVVDNPPAAGTYTYTGRIGVSASATWYIGGFTTNFNYGGQTNTNNQYVLMRIE